MLTECKEMELPEFFKATNHQTTHRNIPQDQSYKPADYTPQHSTRPKLQTTRLHTATFHNTKATNHQTTHRNIPQYSHIYADDVNLLGENINIKNKSTEALLGGSKEVGLEINAEKHMSHHQTTGQDKIVI
jgi:hypothetical protein